MMMDIGRQAFAIDKPRPGAWAMLAVLIGLLILSFIDRQIISLMVDPIRADLGVDDFQISLLQGAAFGIFYVLCGLPIGRSEEHTSELQSLMRISYAVFCL